MEWIINFCDTILVVGESEIEVPQIEAKPDGKRVKTVVEEIVPQQPGGQGFGIKETNNIIPPAEIKEAKGAFLKYFLITFLVTIVILVLIGGIWVYLKGTGGQSLEVSQTPTPQATVTVSMTPVPSANPIASPVPIANYKISVLNGSGKIGAATTAKNLLTRAGFKVASTGNAENFNFDTTLIQVKSTVPDDVVAKLKTSLVGSFSPQIGKALDDADQFDVIITVGLQ